MRRDTITVERLYFCAKAMFTLENVLNGKKLKISLAAGGGGWGLGVGIRMSWVEKFRKIN